MTLGVNVLTSCRSCSEGWNWILNVMLPAFAAERRAASPLLLSTGICSMACLLHYKAWFQDFPGPGKFDFLIPGLSTSWKIRLFDSRTFQVLENLTFWFQDFHGHLRTPVFAGHICCWAPLPAACYTEPTTQPQLLIDISGPRALSSKPAVCFHCCPSEGQTERREIDAQPLQY